MQTPSFIHDCTSCTFLGNARIIDCNYDFYFCGQTIIARYGDSGPDYTSAPIGMISPIMPELILGLALYVKHKGASAASHMYWSCYDKAGQPIVDTH